MITAMDRLEHALKHLANRKLKSFQPGFIYFVQCHDFIKVGLTYGNLDQRLSALQTGCPYELKLIHSFKSNDVEDDERKLHKHWQRYEVRGEWFRLPDSEIIVISASESINDIFD